MSENFHQMAAGFFTTEHVAPLLKEMKLDSIDAIFNFSEGESLVKKSLARWRHRIRLPLPDGRFAYLKRYDNPPASLQIKSWIQHRRRAFLSEYDRGPQPLMQAGIHIPQTLAFGGQWSGLFEKRSFVISLEIPQGHSLEKKLPDCFDPTGLSRPKRETLSQKKAFILKTADFVSRFHATGYRHRDLYLCHLFLSGGQTLYLIDLHRCFRPFLLSRRYALKDLAQLHYSCPAASISRADRLRFFMVYRGHDKLTPADKNYIRAIHRKAMRIAAREKRHGRISPFERASAMEAASC